MTQQQIHDNQARQSSTRLVGAIIACPECSAPAEVEWTTALASTDGCVEHLKIHCVNRHWFFLTSDHAPGF
jgi:hypothetical protein